MPVITVGMTAERSYVFTPENLSLFADLIDDHAPVHIDRDFARAGGFPDRIVHGFFVSSVFSGLLGNQLPGKLSVINQVTLKLHRAVAIGDEVLYRVSVSQVSPATQAVVLKLSAIGPHGEVVLSGSAICSFPPRS